MSNSDKSKITRDVLSYLIDHQDAQDTLEGIVQWWLMEEEIKQQTAKVKAVLDDLVKINYLLESKGMDSRRRYRINQSKMKEISNLIEKTTE
jgi:hypothetical protein